MDFTCWLRECVFFFIYFSMNVSFRKVIILLINFVFVFLTARSDLIGMLAKSYVKPIFCNAQKLLFAIWLHGDLWTRPNLKPKLWFDCFSSDAMLHPSKLFKRIWLLNLFLRKINHSGVDEISAITIRQEYNWLKIISIHGRISSFNIVFFNRSLSRRWKSQQLLS